MYLTRNLEKLAVSVTLIVRLLKGLIWLQNFKIKKASLCPVEETSFSGPI